MTWALRTQGKETGPLYGKNHVFIHAHGHMIWEGLL